MVGTKEEGGMEIKEERRGRALFWFDDWCCAARSIPNTHFFFFL
jgi:hypothetical protein